MAGLRQKLRRLIFSLSIDGDSVRVRRSPQYSTEPKITNTQTMAAETNHGIGRHCFLLLSLREKYVTGRLPGF